MQIFILEDDEAIGIGLTYSLENEGYAVTLAKSVGQAYDIISNNDFALYIKMNSVDNVKFAFSFVFFYLRHINFPFTDCCQNYIRKRITGQSFVDKIYYV